MLLQIAALAARKEAAKAAEEKAKQDEDHLQRLDTAARLELAAAQKEHSWVRRTAIKVRSQGVLYVNHCIRWPVTQNWHMKQLIQ